MGIDNSVCIIFKLFIRSLNFFSLVTFSTSLFAEIKLPAFFGDNMVLQQQTEAAIWGEASPKQDVEVSTSWNHKTYSVTADAEGKWKLKVQTPKAGGPYSITISDGEAIELSNRCCIEIMTATHRGIRGYTVAAAILDEIAFWHCDGYPFDLTHPPVFLASVSADHGVMVFDT